MLGQNKTGLSPFGILSALFTREIMERGEQQIGWYEPLHLQLLEDGEQEEEQPPAPQINVKFDLDVLLRAIREEQDKDEKPDKTPKTPEQRILERIILRERETVIRDSSTRRIILEGGGRRIGLAARMPRSPGSTLIRRQTDRIFTASAETSVPAAEAERRTADPVTRSPDGTVRRFVSRQDTAEILSVSPSEGTVSRVIQRRDGTDRLLLSGREAASGSVTPGSERTMLRPSSSATGLTAGLEREAASRTIAVQTSAQPWSPMALASQVAVSPAGGGWEPRWQELHPGYPSALSGTQHESEAGSILLPDVMRRRRAEAIERHERRNAQGPDVMDIALDWLSESPDAGQETRIDFLESFTRRLKQAVDRTLAERRELEQKQSRGQDPRQPAQEQRPAVRPEAARQAPNSDSVRHPDPVRAERPSRDRAVTHPDRDAEQRTEPMSGPARQGGEPSKAAKPAGAEAGRITETAKPAEAERSAQAGDLTETEEPVKPTGIAGTTEAPKITERPTTAEPMRSTDAEPMKPEGSSALSERREDAPRSEIPGGPDARMPEQPEQIQEPGESGAQAAPARPASDTLTGFPVSGRAVRPEDVPSLDYRELQPDGEQEAKTDLERAVTQTVRELEARSGYREEPGRPAEAGLKDQDRQYNEQGTETGSPETAEPLEGKTVIPASEHFVQTDAAPTLEYREVQATTTEQEPGTAETSRPVQPQQLIEQRTESVRPGTAEPPETQTGIPTFERPLQAKTSPELEYREVQAASEPEAGTTEAVRTEQTPQLFEQRSESASPETAARPEAQTGIPTSKGSIQAKASPELEYREVQAATEPEAGTTEAVRTGQTPQLTEQSTESNRPETAESSESKTGVLTSERFVQTEAAPTLEYREVLTSTTEPEAGTAETGRTAQPQQLIKQRSESASPETSEAQEAQTGIPASEGPIQAKTSPELEYREVQAATEPEAGTTEAVRTGQTPQLTEQRTESNRPETAESSESKTGVPTSERFVQTEAAPTLEYREVSTSTTEPEPGTAETGRTEQTKQIIEQSTESVSPEETEKPEAQTGIPASEGPIQAKTSPELEYREVQAAPEPEAGTTEAVRTGQTPQLTEQSTESNRPETAARPEAQTGIPASEGSIQAKTSPELEYREVQAATETEPGTSEVFRTEQTPQLIEERSESASPAAAEPSEGETGIPASEHFVQTEAAPTLEYREVPTSTTGPEPGTVEAGRTEQTQQIIEQSTESISTETTELSKAQTGIPTLEHPIQAKISPKLEYREVQAATEPEAGTTEAVRSGQTPQLTEQRTESNRPETAESSESKTGIPASEHVIQMEAAPTLEYREIPTSTTEPGSGTVEAGQTEQTQRIIDQRSESASPETTELPEAQTGIPTSEHPIQAEISPELKYREAQAPTEPEAGTTEAVRNEQAQQLIEQRTESNSPATAESSESKTGVPTSERFVQTEAAPTLEYREVPTSTTGPEPGTVEAGRTEQTQQIIEQSTESVSPETTEPPKAQTGIPASEGPIQAKTSPELEYREVQATTEPEAGTTEAVRSGQTPQLTKQRAESASPETTELPEAQTGIPASEGSIQAKASPELEYREVQAATEPEAGTTEAVRNEQAQQLIEQRTESNSPETAESSESKTGVPTSERFVQTEAAPTLEYREVPTSTTEPEPGTVEAGRTEQTQQIIEQRTKSVSPGAAARPEAQTGIPTSEGSIQAKTSPELEYREVQASTEPEPGTTEAVRTGQPQQLTEQRSEIDRPEMAESSESKTGVPTSERFVQTEAAPTLEYREVPTSTTGPEPGTVEAGRTEQTQQSIEQSTESVSPETTEPPKAQTGIPTSEHPIQAKISPELEYREVQTPRAEPEAGTTEAVRTGQTQQLIKQRSEIASPETGEPSEGTTGIPASEHPVQPESAPTLEYREVPTSTTEPEPGTAEAGRTGQPQQLTGQRTESASPETAEMREARTGIPTSERSVQPETTPTLEYREVPTSTTEPEPGTAEAGRTGQPQQLAGQRNESAGPETAEAREARTGIPTTEHPLQPESAPTLEYREGPTPAEPEAGTAEAGRTGQPQQLTGQRTESAGPETAEAREARTGIPTSERPVQPETTPTLEYREVPTTAEPEPGTAEAGRSGQPQQLTGQRTESAGTETAEAREARTGIPTTERPLKPETAPTLEYREGPTPAEPEAGTAEAGRTGQQQTRQKTKSDRPETDQPQEARTGIPAAERLLQPETAPALEYREVPTSTTEPEPGTTEADRTEQAQRLTGQRTDSGSPETKQVQQTEEAAPSETVRPQSAIPGDSLRGDRPWKDQVSLTYTQPLRDSQQEPAEPGRQETQTGRVEPMGVQNLPSWAQDMLRRTGGISNDSFSGPGTIRFDAGRSGVQTSAGGTIGGNRTFPPSGTGKQITWTAPGYPGSLPSQPGPSGPTQMVFRDRGNEPENGLPQRRGMDEKELRKTADKVYRLIEERLRKELRRGGR